MIEIKMPEKITQEPCEDCTVIKKLSKKYYVEDAYGYTDEDIVNKVNEIIDVVNESSSVTPKAEQKWIPVSERLPDYGVSVLTWDGYCYCVEKRIPYIRDEDGEPISSDWWVSDEYDEYDSDYYPNLRDGACIAWMPLPEPYKAESEGEE